MKKKKDRSPYKKPQLKHLSIPGSVLGPVEDRLEAEKDSLQAKGAHTFTGLVVRLLDRWSKKEIDV